MVEITEFDPSEIDDDNYDDMPELCDNDKTNEATNSSDKNTNIQTSDKVENVPAPAVVDADGWEDILGSGRLRRKILTEGDTDKGKPSRGSSCTINIREMLPSGEVVKDETEFVFNLGECEVIQGVELLVPLMFPGEVSTVTMEHTFAYGAGGDGAR